MSDNLAAATRKLPEWSQEPVTIAIAVVAAIVIALALHAVLFRILRRIAQASESATDDLVIKQLTQPARYALLALGLAVAAREIPALGSIWKAVGGFVMPALVGWIALSVLHAMISAVEMRVDITEADNHDARRRLTRLAIFSRIASFIVIFATIGLMLLSIPGVREIGVTLMASAGIAGLAVGAAAQPALKSLIAGLQMAITEPINIDDVIIIEGQWGRVEEIRSTYVVVRTWDERRLIVPMSKFLDDTFENWTREGARLLAPVLLYLDPLTEIEPLRAAFLRFIEHHPLWDQRVAKLQITDAKPTAIEVRLLMSAANASDAFDLRCAAREAMFAWVRGNQPDAIVRHRLEADSPLIEMDTEGKRSTGRA